MNGKEETRRLNLRHRDPFSLPHSRSLTTRLSLLANSRCNLTPLSLPVATCVHVGIEGPRAEVLSAREWEQRVSSVRVRVAANRATGLIEVLSGFSW